MVKLRGLGKGLEALLGSSKVNIEDINEKNKLSLNLTQIELSLIKPGLYQQRRVFDNDELDMLAKSISQQGVIQPILLRKSGINYEIVAGERRWRACKIAGLKTIPAIIKEFTDEEALAVGLIENIQRKGLSIIEEAEGYKRLIDEFKLKHESLAKIFGKSRSQITNILRLLNLDVQVQEMLLDKTIDVGHARAILPLNKVQQLELAKEVIKDSLTTKQVEIKVAGILADNTDSTANSVKLNRNNLPKQIKEIEDMLIKRLSTLVTIKHNDTGSGKVIINYESVDKLRGFFKDFK